MNLVKSFFIFIIFCTFLASYSCKTKKKLAESTLPLEKPKQLVQSKSYEEEIKQIILHSNQTNWLYTKANAKYDDGKQEIGIDLEIQLEKNKEIWINVKAMGFINVARILFQPDSVHILDYINRTYTQASYGYLKNFSPLPVTYSQIENLLLGNVLFPLDVKTTIVQKLPNGSSSYNQFGNFKQRINFNSLLKVSKTIVQDSIQQQSLTINYNQFVTENKNQFPGKINIQLTGNQQLNIEMILNNMTFNKKRDWQLSVPKNYKVHVF